MKSLQYFIAIAVLLLAATTQISFAQLDTLYQEHFTNGSPSLTWFAPWPETPQLSVVFEGGNPSGDGWIGKVDKGGNGVGTALAGSLNLTDYEVHAWVYCTVSGSAGGAYHAICARWDTTGGNYFYYLRTDFDTDQRLQLRFYDGTTVGVTIATWTGAQIPGGVPTQAGWHRMGLKCEGNQLWAWWDNVLLSGCPYAQNDLSRGFFGAYVFRMAGDASTKFDDIVVLGEAGPQLFDLVGQSNALLDSAGQVMSIRPDVGKNISFQLAWAAFNGETTSPPFVNRLYLDDNPIFLENHPGVEPNSVDTTISNQWTATLGDHTIRWVLDEDSTVHESVSRQIFSDHLGQKVKV